MTDRPNGDLPSEYDFSGAERGKHARKLAHQPKPKDDTSSRRLSARPDSVTIYFSEFFDVDLELLDDYGAFDVSLVNDLPLFVDPFLLFNSDEERYRQLHAEVIRYMTFLKEVASDPNLDRGLVQTWFSFPEVSQNWLGFSQEGNRGRGLGAGFAQSLQRGFRTVFRDFGNERVTRASHIEKLCLIRDGVGRDNISDFTTNLIKGYLAEFTQAFAREHLPREARAQFAVSRASFNYDTRSWVTRTFDLPWFENDYVLLTPKNLLTKDDTWINRPDLLRRLHEIADALPNEPLRAQVNDYLRHSIPRGKGVRPSEVRAALARTVDRFPMILDYYVLDREQHGDAALSVSRQRVDEVERRFVIQVRDLVHRLLAPGGFYGIAATTHEQAMRRVQFLKDVIENKGGHQIFYLDGRPLEREADLHLLYRLTWFASTSDVSREVNDGRGPADFKVSHGATDKTLVEFKLAKNSQLERNLEKQTEVYEKASDATYPSIKVIVYFSEKERLRVERILKRLDKASDRNVVLIDARADNKPSGSKA